MRLSLAFCSVSGCRKLAKDGLHRAQRTGGEGSEHAPHAELTVWGSLPIQSNAVPLIPRARNADTWGRRSGYDGVFAVEGSRCPANPLNAVLSVLSCIHQGYFKIF